MTHNSNDFPSIIEDSVDTLEKLKNNSNSSNDYEIEKISNKKQEMNNDDLKHSQSFDNILSSSLYHEYILTLNTLKSQLDRIDKITKFVLEMDRDHAINMKNVVITLNDMIDRMPALKSIPKINYQETPDLSNELHNIIGFTPMDQNIIHSSKSNSQNYLFNSSDIINSNQRAQLSAPKNQWKGIDSSSKHFQEHMSLNDSFIKSMDASVNNNMMYNIDQFDPMNFDTATNESLIARDTDTIDDIICRFRNNPHNLSIYLDNFCKSFEKDHITKEIDPYQLSKDSFPILIQYLVEKVLSERDRFLSGIKILILCQLNGVATLFKAVPQEIRERLIEQLCERQQLIDEKCNHESIIVLKQLYSFLKRITHGQITTLH